MKKIFLTGLFIVNLLVIFVFWWLGSSALVLNPGNGNLLIALGRVAGLLAEFFILIEIVLISRIVFIEKTYGFDKLNQLHRTIGYILGSSIIIHPILILLGYSQLDQVTLGHQLWDFLTNWEDVLNGIIGFGILILVIVISIPYIRKNFKYESWHFSHLFMYAAIAFFFGHQVNTGDVSHGWAFYYWYVLNFSVFGSLILYRFLKPFIIFNKHRFYVEKVVAETHNVYSVYIRGHRMDEFKFEAGQYVHVIFGARELWQPHPFSLSATPNGEYIRISVKALGDFTNKIKDLKPNTKVIIEGPFGRFTEKAALYSKYLFIAGGIGITPIIALVEELSKKAKDIVLLYGNRTPNDIVFKEELAKLEHRHHHILSEISEIGYESGRIDEAKIKKLAPDFKERDIYMCGPKPMMDSIIKMLKKLGVSKNQIHYEKFSY